MDVATSRPDERAAASPAGAQGVVVADGDDQGRAGCAEPGIPEMAGEAARVRDSVTAGATGNDLPQVLHTAPAAVALIDLDAGTVTYANGSAQDLTCLLYTSDAATNREV